LATVINNYVRLGRSPNGKVIANIDSSNRVREGRSPSGDIVATTDGNKMVAAAAAVYLYTKNMIRILE
jgi:hypothetical protein